MKKLGGEYTTSEYLTDRIVQKCENKRQNSRDQAGKSASFENPAKFNIFTLSERKMILIFL